MPLWIYPASVLAMIVVGVQGYILYEAWDRKRKHEGQVKELERMCR